MDFNKHFHLQSVHPQKIQTTHFIVAENTVVTVVILKY